MCKIQINKKNSFNITKNMEGYTSEYLKTQVSLEYYH
jgi:hypothetical protein